MRLPHTSNNDKPPVYEIRSKKRTKCRYQSRGNQVAEWGAIKTAWKKYNQNEITMLCVVFSFFHPAVSFIWLPWLCAETIRKVYMHWHMEKKNVLHCEKKHTDVLLRFIESCLPPWKRTFALMSLMASSALTSDFHLWILFLSIETSAMEPEPSTLNRAVQQLKTANAELQQVLLDHLDLRLDRLNEKMEMVLEEVGQHGVPHKRNKTSQNSLFSALSSRSPRSPRPKNRFVALKHAT